MKIEEAIKQLKPAERFKALILLALIASMTSLATVWMKGSDCKSIETKYQEILSSNAQIMQTNNDLLKDNDEKTHAIMHLDSLLVEMHNIKAMSRRVQAIQLDSNRQSKVVFKPIDSDDRLVTEALKITKSYIKK